MSVDVALDNIRIKELPTLQFGGGVDLDLNDIRINALPPINVGITQIAPINFGVTNLPDFNLNANVAVDKLPPIHVITDSKLATTSTLKSDSTLQTDSTLKTDNKVDLALEVKIKELPRIDLQFGLRPMRFHFPLNYRFCLKLLGIKVFEFETCGEGMVIAEDYKARVAEECK